jgi:acyl carrier protein
VGALPSRDEILPEVLKIVADVAEVPVDALSPDKTLAELDIDSLRGLRIVAAVEQRFGIVIGEEDIEKMRSMKDILALVEAKT